MNWSKAYQEVVWLDNNQYPDSYSQFDAILAVGAFTALKTDHYNAFSDLQEYQGSIKDWIFGYLSYDLKNDTEKLESKNYDGLSFPELYFFQPQKLFLIKGSTVELCYLRMLDDEMDLDIAEIKELEALPGIVNRPSNNESFQKIAINQRISKSSYLEKVQKMLSHIQRGDIYEANFCQEFYAHDIAIDPLQVYQALNSKSTPPFAAFLKLEEFYVMCASPERYLQKIDRKLVSQPIKGTARRGADPHQDEQLKKNLQNDPKERAENLMIVDLVRNDLSRTAEKGSVEVAELCGIHSFKQVHQLVSTVTSELRREVSGVEAIKQSFPMGSMTGAPKIEAMKIIESLEESKRGVYSGAVGYFNPAGDFDFNVVIRSILYNSKEQYVSFSVGSAITSGSLPENEYEECLVKAKAMREVLEGIPAPD